MFPATLEGTTGRASRLVDRYLAVLAVSLAGYALLGKGFAYLGVPPLFIGELLLAAGLIVLLRTRCAFSLLTSLPVVLLVLLILWVLIRTIPYVGQYRIDALRDSVLVMYSAFGLIVACALVDKPERINDLLRYYARFVAVYGLIGGLAFFLTEHFGDSMPTWPSSGVPLLYLRSGEASVHLSGAAVFVVLGFWRPSVIWIALLALGSFLVCASSRGGMLSILVPVAAAIVVGGRIKQAAPAVIAAAVLFCVAYVVNFELPASDKGARVPDVQQVVDNLLSVFVDGNDSLDNTKEWRLLWWRMIVDYTIHGEYYWTGKGFGINLAESDGFLGTEGGAALLRSPHNAHMAILARAGVPGLVLWVLVAVSWFAMMARNMIVARRRGEQVWADFFLFVSCYLGAIVIDSTFDVALEGPMLGIWFWVLFGVGIGSSMIYRGRTVPHGAARPLAHATANARLAACLGAGFVLLLAVTPGSPAHADSFPEGSDDWQVRRDLVGKSIENSAGSCLVLKNEENVIVENVELGPCGEHGIVVTDSRNVIIRNVTIRDTGDAGVRILGSSSVAVVSSSLTNTRSGISAQSSQGLRIECNSFRDVRGPIPSGQFVQFNDVSGPANLIACNDCRNTPGRGNPEDAISLYKSHGTDSSPITITRNLIVGGGPSPSGGGIMLGDDGGSDLVATENTLIDPGQYGIGVASGERIRVVGNNIYARRQHFTNVGIYVWNQYDHKCNDIDVTDNRVYWRAADGSFNPWWDGENCGPVTGLSTNVFTSQEETIPSAELHPECDCSALLRPSP